MARKEKQRARNAIYKRKKKAEREASLLSRGGPRDPRLRAQEARRPPEPAPSSHCPEVEPSRQTTPKAARATKPAWDATPDSETFDKLIEDITRCVNSPIGEPRSAEVAAPTCKDAVEGPPPSPNASSSSSSSPSSTSSSSPSSTSSSSSSSSSTSSNDPLDPPPPEGEAIKGGATNSEPRLVITAKRPERSGPWTTDPTARRPTDPAKWDPLWRPACAHVPQTRPRPPFSRNVDLKRLGEVRRNLLESISQQPPPRVIKHHTTNDDPSRKRKRRAPPKAKGGKRPRKR